MEKIVVIKNETGLHARPAGMFVKKASEFTSTIEVKCKGKVVNAKSIMGIMSLGLGKGEEVTKEYYSENGLLDFINYYIFS